MNCFYQAFPVINLGEITLREISTDDHKAYYSYMNNIKMLEFLNPEHIPSNENQAEEELKYWRSLFVFKKSVYWAIVDKNDKIIGTAGFNHISFKNHKAEISYDLDPECWGLGYMSQVLKRILLFAQEELDLVRIQATVTIENERSVNLLKKCGFQKEGLLEKYEIVNGVHKDYFMYSRIFGDKLDN